MIATIPREFLERYPNLTDAELAEFTDCRAFIRLQTNLDLTHKIPKYRRAMLKRVVVKSPLRACSLAV